MVGDIAPLAPLTPVDPPLHNTTYYFKNVILSQDNTTQQSTKISKTSFAAEYTFY